MNDLIPAWYKLPSGRDVLREESGDLISAFQFSAIVSHYTKAGLTNLGLLCFN